MYKILIVTPSKISRERADPLSGVREHKKYSKFTAGKYS